MDILTRLFGNMHNNEDLTDEDLTDEELEAAAEIEKADRKRFHREKVANGPVKFTSVSNGQARRGETRRRKAQSRKANRRHRKEWMESRYQHAVLRGQLMAVGVLPGSAGVPAPTSPETAQYMAWLLERRYGSVTQALAIWQRAQAQIDAEQAKIDEAEALRKLQARLDDEAKAHKARAGQRLQAEVDAR